MAPPINKKKKGAEPQWKRWVDKDGHIHGNDLHARQAEREKAALREKLEKKKAGAARDAKKKTKAQRGEDG